MKTNEDPAWQAKLTSIVKEHAEGDIISHQEINALLGLEEPRFLDYQNHIEYKEALTAFAFVRMSAIEQLKHDLLVCCQCYIKNVAGEGYRIVPAKDQCETAYRHYIKEIHNSFEDGQLVMENVRSTALNADEKKKANDYKAKFALLQQMFENNRK